MGALPRLSPIGAETEPDHVVAVIGLSIPVLIFIPDLHYNKNSAGMVSILNDAVAQTSQAGVERTQDLIENTESPLRFLADWPPPIPAISVPKQTAICCIAP